MVSLLILLLLFAIGVIVAVLADRSSDDEIVPAITVLLALTVISLDVAALVTRFAD